MQRIDSMLSCVPHLGKEDTHGHTFQNVYTVTLVGAQFHILSSTSIFFLWAVEKILFLDCKCFSDEIRKFICREYVFIVYLR